MHIRRMLLLAGIFLCLALAAGCARVDMECGLTPTHEAYIRYAVRVDKPQALAMMDEDALAYALGEAAENYEARGFAVEREDEEDFAWLYFSWEEAHEDAAQAFAALKGKLEDDRTTLLLSAALQHAHTAEEDAFSVVLETDLSRVPESVELSNFPGFFADQVRDSFNALEGSMAITLPADSVERAQGEAEVADGMATVRTELDMSGPGRVEMATRKSIRADAKTKLEEWRAYRETLMQALYGLAGAAVVFAALAIWAGIARGRAKRRAKAAETAGSPPPDGP